MTAPRNQSELRRAIDSAWGQYEATLKQLLDASGYDTSRGWGLAAAHARLGQPAADAYQAFLLEQDRINQEFGKYIDAPVMAAIAHLDYQRAIHNAEAPVGAARSRYDQIHQHLNRIRRGELCRYGVNEPSAAELANEARLQADLDAVTASVEPARESATAKRDAALAALERIRPGVSTGKVVSQPDPMANLRSPQARQTYILEKLRTYQGPMTRRGHPRLRGPDGFRRHAAMRDITPREVRAAWPHVRLNLPVSD